MVASVVSVCVACTAPQKSDGLTYYDSKVGKNPSLEKIYEQYQPLLDSMLQAESFCTPDIGEPDEYCDELKEFYTSDKRMQLVNYVEDLADTTEHSHEVQVNLDNLSDLMQYRARFLATLTAYEFGIERMVLFERIIENMIKELESSPLNSRRHQKYSEKAIPLLKRATFEESWLREMDELER